MRRYDRFPGSGLQRILYQDNRGRQGILQLRDERYTDSKRAVLEHLISVITTFGPFKTASEDGIFPAMLQQDREVILFCPYWIYRACGAFEYITMP